MLCSCGQTTSFSSPPMTALSSDILAHSAVDSGAAATQHSMGGMAPPRLTRSFSAPRLLHNLIDSSLGSPGESCRRRCKGLSPCLCRCREVAGPRPAHGCHSHGGRQGEERQCGEAPTSALQRPVAPTDQGHPWEQPRPPGGAWRSRRSLPQGEQPPHGHRAHTPHGCPPVAPFPL